MEKSNIRRLMDVMVPFCIMVTFQRLGLMVTMVMPAAAVVREVIAFTAAAAVGIIFFRLSCGGESLRLRRGITEEEDGGDDSRVPPFPEADTWFGQLLYTMIGFGALIAVMHAVTMLSDMETAVVFEEGTAAAEFVSLVLIHPILEEYLFRGLYYRGLRPMQPIFAGLAQAVMFAIVHGSVGGMIYALFAGVVLVFISERSGSLLPPVLAHILVNLRSFLFVTVLADGMLPQAERVRLMIDFVLVSAAFGAVLIRMVRRGLREIWNAADADDDDERKTVDE